MTAANVRAERITTPSKVPSIIITFFFFDYFHSDVERERRQTFYFYFSDLSISAGCAVQRCRVRPGSFWREEHVHPLLHVPNWITSDLVYTHRGRERPRA